jgi:hypothetical protein
LNFKTTGKRLLSRMSTHLAELILASTSVIEPTSSLQIHPKTLNTISSVCISNLYQSLPRQIRYAIKARGHVTKYWMFGGYNSIYYEVIASQTSTNCNGQPWNEWCVVPVLIVF